MGNKSKAKKVNVGNLIVYGIIALVVVFAAYVLICNLTNNIPFVFGYSFAHILTGSMEDTIPEDSYILVKKVDPDDIKTEDIILFISKDPSIFGKINTHRVVDISITDGTRVFTTKGDANYSADTDFPVYDRDIKGIYVMNLKKVTAVVSYFRSKPIIFIIVIIIPSFIALAWSMKDTIYEIINLKKNSKYEEELNRLKREGLSAEDLELINNHSKDTTDNDNEEK